MSNLTIEFKPKKWQLKKFAIVSVILAIMNIIMLSLLLIGGPEIFDYTIWILLMNILMWCASIYGLLSGDIKKKNE